MTDRDAEVHHPWNRDRIRQRHIGIRVLVVVLALLLAACSSGGDHATSGPTTTTTPSTVQPTPTTTPTAMPVTAAALIGPWRAVSIAGYTGPDGEMLRFDGQGRWRGSSGCNTTRSSYRLGPNGRFQLFGGGMTAVRCTYAPSLAHPSGGEVPTPPFPLTAVRIELLNGRLTFFARNGSELAQYERLNVTARVVLLSRTMTAGSSMSGHVIVENNTGSALFVTGCISLFGISLSNSKIHQVSAFRACAQRFTIPVGESSYRVTVDATYSGCSETGQPQGADPVCLPNGGIPPLPFGQYEATLLQSSVVVPIPPPIALTVTRQRPTP